MNIPRQFYGMNYLSRIIDNFKDCDQVVYPKMEYHSITKGIDVPLPPAKPYEQGLNTQILSNLFLDLALGREIKLDGLAIACGESELFNAYRKPYCEDMPHITNSTCKTIVAIAVMFAIAEKRLKESDLVLSFFPEYDSLLVSKNVKQMTVYHLLTMTSCSKCTELASLTETNWVKAFLLSDCQETPGSKFIYNSMNTYMLSAILVKITGQSLMDYLKQRLFAPLGICNIKWELCPQGIERGGWGLHLSLTGMLKIGLFLANDGAFEGKQLIQPGFIRRMKENHVSQDVDGLAVGYGFQLWHLPNSVYMLSGMYGQHVLFDEKRKLVIATNAHNDKMFPDSVLTRKLLAFYSNTELFVPKNKIMELRQMQELLLRKEAFSKNWDLHLFKKKQMHLNLRTILNKRELQKQASLRKRIKQFDGKRLHIDHATFKLFPYMLQGMYQYPPFHVTDIVFKQKEDTFTLCFYKEKSKKNNDTRKKIVLEAGINYYYNQIISFGEDKRCVACKAFCAKDEDSNDVVMLDIVFPDAGFSRIIKLFLLEDRISVECLEYPNVRQVMEQVLYGETTLAGNRIDLSDKMPQSLRIFLEQKVEPRVNGYLRN